MTERRPKYGNRKTEVDGYLFDSAAEARRYRELKLLEAAGEIENLMLQPSYKLVVNEKLIGKYIGDFYYTIRDAHNCLVPVLEDVKGCKTAVYRLKKKLVEALYSIKITEVSA